MVDVQELVKNVLFDIAFVSAVLCLVILCLFGGRYSTSYSNVHEMYLFYHCAAPFLVALAGIVVGYFEEVHEPSKMEVVIYPVGGILFLVSGILQVVAYSDDNSGDPSLLALHLVVGILLAVAAGICIYKLTK